MTLRTRQRRRPSDVEASQSAKSAVPSSRSQATFQASFVPAPTAGMAELDKPWSRESGRINRRVRPRYNPHRSGGFNSTNLMRSATGASGKKLAIGRTPHKVLFVMRHTFSTDDDMIATATTGRLDAERCTRSAAPAVLERIRVHHSESQKSLTLTQNMNTTQLLAMVASADKILDQNPHSLSRPSAVSPACPMNRPIFFSVGGPRPRLLRVSARSGGTGGSCP